MFSLKIIASLEEVNSRVSIVVVNIKLIERLLITKDKDASADDMCRTLIARSDSQLNKCKDLLSGFLDFDNLEKIKKSVTANELRLAHLTAQVDEN